MKKHVAKLMIMVMVVMAFSPLSVFADEAEGLEQAIRAAKEKFEIPEMYSQFEYDVQAVGDVKTWNMIWRSENANDGMVQVSIDSAGMVAAYNFYKPSKSEGSKLPALSREEAQGKAEVFLEDMEAGLAKQLVPGTDRESYLGSSTYSFQYVRSVSGVPYYGNGVQLEVQKDTGEIQSYYRNWDSKITFPSMEGVIGLTEAESAYQEKIGLELLYQYKIEDDKVEPYLVYAPKESGNVWIDAFTGERVESSSYGIFYGGDFMKRAAGEEAADGVLTPEEIRAVNEIGQLISGEEAENILRKQTVVGLDKSFAIENMRLEKSWPDRMRYRWALSFKQAYEEKGNSRYRYVYGTVDAQNGEILSFGNYSYPADEEGLPAYDRDAALEAVEAFLKDFAPLRHTAYVFEEQSAPIRYETDLGQPEQRFYTFQFTRREGEIPFRANRITIGFDAVSGKVQSYDLIHFYADFPTGEKASSLEAAHEALYEKIGMELLYVNTERYAPEIISAPDAAEIRLVYGLKPQKPAILEAETLEVLNADGSLYREPAKIVFEDIERHYARQAIEALAQNGITEGGTAFRPEENIKQKDFFLMFIHTMGYYVPEEKDETFYKNMYSFLVREEILSAEDIDYDAAVTRAEAVKYLVRGMGYERLALVPGIFVVDFKDLQAASPGFLGYAAIAKGLGIIEGYGGNFQPTEALKRGDAAIMIYNRLNR